MADEGSYPVRGVTEFEYRVLETCWRLYAGYEDADNDHRLAACPICGHSYLDHQIKVDNAHLHTACVVYSVHCKSCADHLDTGLVTCYAPPRGGGVFITPIQMMILRAFHEEEVMAERQQVDAEQKARRDELADRAKRSQLWIPGMEVSDMEELI